MRCIALHKAPGHAFRLYPRLSTLLRELAPGDRAHPQPRGAGSRVPAWVAGVPVRIHGEHGRDVGDLDGSSARYQRVRRLYRPFVTHYVALSRDLERYLRERHRRAGGADRPDLQRRRHRALSSRASGRARRIDGCPFQGRDHWLVGTVGRMQAVKDQTNLARAFVAAHRG